MNVEFVKMQGIGNDFVMLDNMSGHLALAEPELRQLANRRLGVGCDQVLVAEASGHEQADIAMRVYNADGSAAAQCGNGLRCFALFARERGLTDADWLTVETAGNTARVQILADARVRVDMGVPAFEPTRVPLRVDERRIIYALRFADEEVMFAAVSIGNPHAVVRVDDVETAPVTRLGPRLQADERFVEGVNVGFMEIVSRGRIKLRVYERGVGETLACGTGACAAVVAGIDQGLLDRHVDVELRGGVLHIEWPGPRSGVALTGSARRVFKGTIEL